ncbi:MAG: zinc-dependent metalloprotease [Acidobacteriota bacterium]
MSRSLSRFRLPAVLLFTAVAATLVGVSAIAEGNGSGSDGQPPSVSELVAGLEARDGLLKTYPDPKQGKVWLELPKPDDDGLVAEVLYIEGLLSGLGSNPVGLDRGQLGPSRLLQVRRLGDRVLFEEPNPKFRASSESADERRATTHSFATSVLWGSRVSALDPDGRALVDLTPFLIRDAHGVVRTLAMTEQGAFALDPERSAVDFANCLAFPDNLEFEAILTYGNTSPEPAGDHVASTSPNPDAVTLIQHHSFIRLPEPGYTPRPHDPRISANAIEFSDYSAPLDRPIQHRWVTRHRLDKVNPGPGPSPAVEPIVYYVDRGAPEPVRSALVEGAAWWAEAFEAAGFENAYRVELLPEGAHPLDVRYNVIQWVHRSTRGWSYGGGVVDPRTGELIKGHVSLGSLRVRQDRLIFEGLVGTTKTGTGDADDPVQIALARIRQLSAHEVGHTLGLAHNFAASGWGDRASVMDYPAPRVRVGADGELDLSDAYGVGVGAWDVHTIRWTYSEFAPGADEAQELEAIVRHGLDSGYLFIADQHSRPPEAADPRGNLWDNGEDAVAELEEVLRVRALALERFGEDRIHEGEPVALLQEVLAPIYFYHRYQLEAAVKTLGGLEFHYALRGDGQWATRMVDAERQARALDVILGILDPQALDLPEAVLSLLGPRPFGYGPNRELFDSATEPAFDALGAAATAVDHVLDGLLQPQRLARVADFHRRRPELPSVGSILDALVERAGRNVTSAGTNPRWVDIAGVTEQRVMARLIGLATNPDVDAGLRAEAESALGQVQDQLGPRRDTRSAWMRSELDRFFARPWEPTPSPRAAAPPPPGSPIGSVEMAGCSMAHGHGR